MYSPVFQDITPMGREGSPCVIQGDFQEMLLYLNGESYPIQYQDTTTIRFDFPPRGIYEVSLESSYGSLSASSIISLGGNVSITQLVPSSGPANRPAIIQGHNLDYTSQVWFGDVSAAINYKAEGYVNVSVPAGAEEVSVVLYDVQNVSYMGPTYRYRNPNVSTVFLKGRPFSTVTLIGVHLENTTSIEFRNDNLSVEKINTSVTFTVPSLSGNVSMILVDEYRNRTFAGDFHYIQPRFTDTGIFSGTPGDIFYLEGEDLEYIQQVKMGTRIADFSYQNNNLRIEVPPGQRQRWITAIDNVSQVYTYPNKFLYTEYSSISIHPLYGRPNMSVDIHLSQFGNVSHVEMGGQVLNYANVSQTGLQIKLPSLTGVVSVEVVDSEGEVMAAPFRYETIFMDHITPMRGISGTILWISGSRLSTVSRIEFGGVLANYTILTDSLIQVTVPPNLPEFTQIICYDSMENLGTYDTPFETLYSFVNDFTKSGKVGDLFTVSGANLSTTKAITFDGVPAKDLIVMDNQLSCTIPYGIISPDIRMIDRMGTSYDIALRFTDEDVFTYLPSIPQIVSGKAQCLSYDGRLYQSYGTTVTSGGHIFTNVLPILGMVVDDSILYICDGTNYIGRFNLSTRKSLPRYTTETSVKAIKRYRGKLYALCEGSLTVFGDTRTVFPIDSRDYQGLAVDESIYLTYLDPYDKEDPPPVIYGQVCRMTLEGVIEETSFLTELHAPKDLIVVRPYLYIAGTFVYQYNLVNPNNPVTYRLPGSNYTSLAYVSGQLYLANSGTNEDIQTIPAPLEPSSTVTFSNMTARGLSGCEIELIGTNLDKINTLTFNHQDTRLVKISSTYLSFRAPVGTGTPTLRLLDASYQSIPHGLSFTYENVVLYQCSPRQGVENQSLYLFGEHLDKVKRVYIGDKWVENVNLLRPTTLQLFTPEGSGVATITLVDEAGNVISSEVTFSYDRIHSVICFQRGTQVYSDQGAIEIQKLLPHVHTIYGQPIQAITATYYNEEQLIRIEANALGPGCPESPVHISKLHKIFFQGRMIPAYRFLHRPGFSWIPYDGEKLYNVLLYREGRMNVQGMVCETLDPRNPVAEVFTSRQT